MLLFVATVEGLHRDISTVIRPECVSIGPFDFQQQEQLRQQQEQLRQQEEAAAAAAACLPGNEIMPIKMEVKSEAETDTPAVSTTKPEASTGDG